MRLAGFFLVADTNEGDVREPIERQQRADVGLEGRTRIIGSSRQHRRVTRGNQHHDRLGCEQRPVGVFGFSGESERAPDANDLVEPGLELCRHAEVVERRSDHDRIRAIDLVEQRVAFAQRLVHLHGSAVGFREGAGDPRLVDGARRGEPDVAFDHSTIGMHGRPSLDKTSCEAPGDGAGDTPAGVND